jgi:hypothetical protein
MVKKKFQQSISVRNKGNITFLKSDSTVSPRFTTGFHPWRNRHKIYQCKMNLIV